ncbi:MAG: hypothetical protein ACJ8NS_06945 [Chthoniobacterales bacterium]
MKTRKQSVSLSIAGALFGAFLALGVLSAQAAEKVTTTTVTKVRKVTKAGWWIRVNPEKTQATSISLQIGMTKKDSKMWRTWTPGQGLEFDVPAELLNAAKLYIRATTDPKNKHALFCVFYMDHAVEQFHFDGDVDHEMKPSDSDRECRP